MNTEEEKIIVYVVFAVLFIMSIILISGHAPWLVAGYNTATKKERKGEYRREEAIKNSGRGDSSYICISPDNGITYRHTFHLLHLYICSFYITRYSLNDCGGK